MAVVHRKARRIKKLPGTPAHEGALAEALSDRENTPAVGEDVSTHDLKPKAGRAAVALILKGYPRLSETFIAQEILGLERLGVSITLFSLRHPTDKATHPIHDEISAPVIYLPEYLHRAPWTVIQAVRRMRHAVGWRSAWSAFFRDLKRDRTRNRVRRMGQAFVFAEHLRKHPELSLIYAHFLHTPASVARYAALLLDMTWTCSAHAKDIWTSPEWEIKEKLVEMEWLVTCTKTGADYLSGLANGPDKVSLLYHGLDLQRFPPRPDRDHLHIRSGRPVTILSVGRLVPKKGYETLLEALSQINQDLNWRFVHIGGGTMADKLADMAQSLGIADRIEWRGAQPQTDVLAAYSKSDIFVLASQITADGDRDGLPNVIVEAQSQGLPVVATEVSAIPELIRDGYNGLLVPPTSPQPLSEALERLINEPELRIKMGEAGATLVRSTFDHRETVAELAGKIQATQSALG
ncbi:MAG: glycosyltransferase family 4 protein, partial [Pseudomonadota bacterium]